MVDVKQKPEIDMPKELEIQIDQMAFRELEEGHRQRGNAAKLNGAELVNNGFIVKSPLR